MVPADSRIVPDFLIYGDFSPHRTHRLPTRLSTSSVPLRTQQHNHQPVLHPLVTPWLIVFILFFYYGLVLCLSLYSLSTFSAMCFLLLDFLPRFSVCILILFYIHLVTMTYSRMLYVCTLQQPDLFAVLIGSRQSVFHPSYPVPSPKPRSFFLLLSACGCEKGRKELGIYIVLVNSVRFC